VRSNSGGELASERPSGELSEQRKRQAGREEANHPSHLEQVGLMSCLPRGLACIVAALLSNTVLSESTFCACEGPSGASGLVLRRPCGAITAVNCGRTPGCADSQPFGISYSTFAQESVSNASSKAVLVAGALGDLPKPYIRNALRGASLNDEQ
jgi:hypothetical protein